MRIPGFPAWRWRPVIGAGVGLAAFIVVVVGAALWLPAEELDCEGRPALDGRFRATVSNLNVREGPGTRFPVIRTGEGGDRYFQVTPKHVVQAFCRDGEWIHGKVVAVNGRDVDGRAGWVHGGYLTPANAEPRVTAQFHDREDLTATERRMLDYAAARALTDEPACRQVIGGGRAATRQLAFYLVCADQGGERFNIHFTGEALTVGEPLSRGPRE